MTSNQLERLIKIAEKLERTGVVEAGDVSWLCGILHIIVKELRDTESFDEIQFELPFDGGGRHDGK